MRAHTLFVTRTASYYTLGSPHPGTKASLARLPRLRPLAQYFLRHIQALDDGQHSRGSGSADYVAYLNQLYRQIRSQLSQGVQVKVLGFYS